MAEQTIIEELSSFLEVDPRVAEIIFTKAQEGSEMDNSSPLDWLENRFKPNVVFIDKNEYAQMCIDALKVVGKTTPTDYGSSRQRDFGQIWADTTRGYLGEQALVKFFAQKFGKETKLGHDRGQLEDYLKLDIREIKDEQGHWRTPKIQLGVKAIKWNGIWLDIPGNEFAHSDIHALVKVGVARDHLFAFFKSLSVFQDKIFAKGREVGVLTEQEAQSLYDELPSLGKIPAYICGFVKSDRVFSNPPYKGVFKRTIYWINGWNGPRREGHIEEIKRLYPDAKKVQFAGIGDFSHDSGHLFNAGSLQWTKTEWDEIVKAL